MSVSNVRPARRPAALLAAGIVLAGLGLLAGSCREPVRVVEAFEIRAAALDTTHVALEFPESLDPVAMSDPANVVVEAAEGGSGARRALAVRAVSVPDTVQGRCLVVQTEKIPDGTSLWVTVDRVRLFTGPRLGREPVTVDLVSGLSYWKDLAPLLARRCNSCHSGGAPAGEYTTDSYFALYGNGVSPPGNLLPADSTSLLVRKCQPGGTMYRGGHLEFIDAEIIRHWVVDYGARQ